MINLNYMILKCKISLTLKDTKHNLMVLDEEYNAKYRTSFWNDNIKIISVKYGDIWLNLDDFKEIFYSDEKIIFDSLKINVLL